MTIPNLVTLLVPLTLFTVMFGLGVGLPLDAFRQWRQTWPLVVRLELATCLLVPLVAWLLLLTPPAAQLPIGVRTAIALMAACPSAPLILRKAGKTGGDRSLAGLLQVPCWRSSRFLCWRTLASGCSMWRDGMCCPGMWPSRWP
jgi:predicted Na+-dependent transporter